MRNAVRPPTTRDLAYVAARMAEADRQEVIATVGHDDVKRVLFDAVIHSSMCWTFEPDDEPVCLFGAVPLNLLGTGASPWLLGTDDVRRYPLALVKGGRACVLHMLREYPYLVNYVDARHEISLRWLERLGFTVGPAVPYGAEGLPFHKVELWASR